MGEVGLAVTVAAGSPPSAMAWCWGGAGLAAAARAGGGALVASGATPAAPARFGTGTRVEEATTNLAANPSLETNTTGFAASGGGSVSIAQHASAAVFGSTGLRSTCDGTASLQGFKTPSGTSGTAVSASTAYAVSASVKASIATTLRISLIWSDSGGTFISQDDTDSAVTTATARISATATSPAGAAFLEVRIRRVGASAAMTHDMDGLQIEAKAYVTSYCDGSLGAGYSWSGTAHASTSSRATGRLRARSEEARAACGAVALWWRPDAAATHAVDRTLLRWGAGTAFLDVTYRQVSDRFRFTAQAGAGSADSVDSAVQSFAAGADLLVVAGWEEQRLSIAVGESAAVFASRAVAVPVIADCTFDVGSDGAGAQAAGGLGPALWFERPLTVAERTVLARLARAPRWGEVA